MGALTFGIVIPTLNSEETLAETLLSVSSQLGNNRVRVHLQDGGSTDRTVSLAKIWADNLSAEGRFNVSIDSRPDSGPADAVNRGFQSLDADVLTWLGADDILLPHAIVTVASFLGQHPEAHWVTGVAQQINDTGVSLSLRGVNGSARLPTGFSQRALVRGSHASRLTGFIQQEGTFWTTEAWRSSGERIETELKLAFDFELWCRMAKHYELVQLATPLAMFRKRVGQLSEDRSAYSAEVKQVREGLNRNRGPRPSTQTSTRKAIASLNPNSGVWHIERYLFGPQLLRRIAEGMCRHLDRNSTLRTPEITNRAP